MTANSHAVPSARSTFLDNRVPPPLVMALFGAFMWSVSGIGPRLGISAVVATAGGVVVTLSGVALLVTAFLTFRRAGTTIDPIRIDRASQLVTQGVFSRSRNPMYVAFTLMLIGWSLYLASWVALVGPVLFVWFIDRFQIVPEERTMHQLFGDAYADYCRRVRRWL